MRTKYHFFLITLLFNVLLWGEQVEKEGAEGVEEKEYIKLIIKKCPKADIIEIEEAEDYLEIEYICDGRVFEIGVKNGEILFQETKPEQATIPIDKIRRKINKKYPEWLLDEILLVTTQDTSFYKVEIVKDGIEQNLFFTITGKWYKLKSIASSDKWNIANLKSNRAFHACDYDILAPSNIHEMPNVLNEISGIAVAGSNKVLCIQDELGAVFEFNLAEESITNIYRFTDVGDFEDIAINGDSLFILRSDGNVFNFNYKNYTGQVTQKIIPLNTLNIEGLFYNKADKHIYIVNKEPLTNAEDFERVLFRYSPDATHKPEPYLKINTNELAKLLKKNFPEITQRSIMFNPSAVAMHPITKDIYLLSSTHRLLAIYRNKELKAIYPLPADLYYKPEGISFFTNGDMLIACEGDKRGLTKGCIVMIKLLK